MDPITHGLLGATLGQAAFGRSLGWRQATALGAVGAMLPDLDILAVPFGGPLGEFRFHRAATHAIWVAPVLGPLLAEGLWRFRQRRTATSVQAPGTRRALGLLLTLALLTHPLLDLMTTYGIQIFWPLRARFALDAVPIVDVFYTGLLLVALLCGRSWQAARPRWSQAAAALALAATSAYLGYGFALNQRAAATARRELRAAGWTADEVKAYPTLLQPWLRRVVARRGSQVRVGLLSSWAPRPIAWHGFEQPRLEDGMALEQAPDAQLFVWFAMGQVTWRVVELSGREYVELEDLRFGYGQTPDQGLWGVRMSWDGRALGAAERFDRPPPPLGGMLLQLWSAALGLS